MSDIEFASTFGLTAEETQKFCEKLNRMPTKEELAVCGSLWSEHCSYKSSRVHLKRFHTQEPWVLQGPGENAGVVAITENYGIAFKMESHNHPSYIEPYQGAATGVGGILRDIFCMGAMPIANLNCLRFGEGTWNATLIRDTVRGIGDYGNSVGVPTVGGDISFHFNYSQNILVNAFTAGLIHKDKIFKGVVTDSEASSNHPQAENVLIYFGSATGRDGVHGATMSSAEFLNSSATLKPTVQVGDPFAEKVLLAATLSLIEKKLVIGLQDMGAAGLTSSTVEMGGRSDCGVTLDLNKVPTRASNMEAWEILLSESQERMVCAVTPDKVNDVLKELEKFNLSSAIIGHVNNSGLFVCTFDGKIVTEIPIPLLIEDVPRYSWPLQEREDYLKEHSEIKCEAQIIDDSKLSVSLYAQNKEAHKDIEENMALDSLLEKHPDLIQNLFSHPANASRAPVYQHYCSTVQGNTITGCGTYKSSSAAVIRLPLEAQEDKNGHKTQFGVAVAAGCEERLVELDPYTGSALSVLKIARKIIASGGIPLAMTDCLNFGSPKSPAVMLQISDAVDGINFVAKELRIPIVSGNVSLNNQTSGRPIPPTPMLGIVGKIEDVSQVPLDRLPLRYFTNPDNKEMHLVHFRSSQAIELSSYQSSQTAWILGGVNSHCPKLDLNIERTLWQNLQNAIKNEQPELCFPVGHGGVFGALISCALKSECEVELSPEMWKTSARTLFAEGNMGFVLGFATKERADKFIQTIDKSDFNADKLATFFPKGKRIAKTVFALEPTLNVFLNSLHRYFNINSR